MDPFTADGISNDVYALMATHATIQFIGLVTVILTLALKSRPKRLVKKQQLITEYNKETASGKRFILFWKLFIRNAQARRVKAWMIGNFIYNALRSFIETPLLEENAPPLNAERFNALLKDPVFLESWMKRLARNMAAVSGTTLLVIFIQTVDNVRTGKDSRLGREREAVQKGMSPATAKKKSNDDLLYFIYDVEKPTKKSSAK